MELNLLTIILSCVVAVQFGVMVFLYGLYATEKQYKRLREFHVEILESRLKSAIAKGRASIVWQADAADPDSPKIVYNGCCYILKADNLEDMLMLSQKSTELPDPPYHGEGIA